LEGYDIIKKGGKMRLSVIKKIEGIKNDRIHGANWLSRETLEILKYGIEKIEVKNKKELLEKITDLGKKLVEAKPAMTPILNNVSEVIYELSRESKIRDLNSLRIRGMSKIDELLRRSRLAFKNCARYGANLIEENDKIITCSYSSTICEVFKITKRKKVELKIARSKFKSQNYGEITSKIIKEYGISNKVIPDKNIERYISKVKKVLVGADSILRDGSLINGIPTYQIALAAKGRIPFYVICESAKFNINNLSVPRQGKGRLEEGFDFTPGELITEIVTEFGRIKPQEVTRALGVTEYSFDTLKALC
jgi:translation initiation factor eIF-2B subunit delta